MYLIQTGKTVLHNISLHGTCQHSAENHKKYENKCENYLLYDISELYYNRTIQYHLKKG